MDKLKKCPFCGGTAKLKECLGDHWIACSMCGASVGFDLDEIDCISSWNKRHLTSAMHSDGEGCAAFDECNLKKHVCNGKSCKLYSRRR